MKERLSGSSMLRQAFLKKWIKGLKIYSRLSTSTSIWDRKKAIKLSADIAIASTSNSYSSTWSQALMADIATREKGTNRIFIEQILGHKIRDQKKPSSARLIKCSKKILRRSHVSIARRKARNGAVKGHTVIARTLVEKRTRVLKRLVPGGEQMDEISLIREALDYIVSLRAQRDVMKHVAGAAERFVPTFKL